MLQSEFDRVVVDQTIVQYIGISPNKGFDARSPHVHLKDFFNRRAIVRRKAPGQELAGMDLEIQFAGPTKAWHDGRRMSLNGQFLAVVSGLGPVVTPDLVEEALSRNAEAVASKLDADLRDASGGSEDFAQELRAWWLDQASNEVEPLISKAIEYGGNGRDANLDRLGQQMINAGVEPQAGGSPAELAIYFYVQGKMSRWAAAVAAGQAVSDDTLYDIGIYARMLQRIRETGGWPV